MRTSKIYLLAACFLAAGNIAQADEPTLPKKGILAEKVYNATALPSGDWKELKMNKNENEYAGSVTTVAEEGILKVQTEGYVYTQQAWYQLNPGFDNAVGYSIEIKARSLKADEYGSFSIQGFDKSGKGFRIGLYKDYIAESTNPLMATKKLATNTSDWHTYRIAVDTDGKAHLYRELDYIDSFETIDFKYDNIIKNGGFEDGLSDDTEEANSKTVIGDWIKSGNDYTIGLFERVTFSTTNRPEGCSPMDNGVGGKWFATMNNKIDDNGNYYHYPQTSPIPMKQGVSYTTGYSYHNLNAPNDQAFRNFRLWWNASDPLQTDFGKKKNLFHEVELKHRTVADHWGNSTPYTFSSLTTNDEAQDSPDYVANEDKKTFVVSLSTGHLKANKMALDNFYVNEVIDWSGVAADGRSFFQFGKQMGTEVSEFEIEYISFDITGAYAPDVVEDLTGNADLSLIRIDGQPMAELNETEIQYTITLPVGTTQIPQVQATTLNDKAEAITTQATTLPGNAIIVVTSEDQSNKKTYTISFVVDVLAEKGSLTKVYDATNADPTKEGWSLLQMNKTINDAAAPMTWEVKDGALTAKSENETGKFSQLALYQLNPEFDPATGYTVEIRVKVKNAKEYGAFNIQGFDKSGKGFRIGIYDDKVAESTNPLLATNVLNDELDNTGYNTYRIAVDKYGQAHVYRNAVYLKTVMMSDFRFDNIIKNGGFEDLMKADDATFVHDDWQAFAPYGRGIFTRIESNNHPRWEEPAFGPTLPKSGQWMGYLENQNDTGAPTTFPGQADNKPYAYFAHPRYAPIPVKVGTNYSIQAYVFSQAKSDDQAWRDLRIWWNEANYLDYNGEGVAYEGSLNGTIVRCILDKAIDKRWQEFKRDFTATEKIETGKLTEEIDVKTMILNIPTGEQKINKMCVDDLYLTENINWGEIAEDGRSFFQFGKSMGTETAEFEIDYVAFDVTGAYAPERSNDATLSEIKVQEVAIAEFEANKTEYKVVLPMNTAAVPAITATATNSEAKVVVTPAADLTKATTIVVTAQDGKATKTYTITFEVSTVASTNAELAEIKLNGVKLESFDAKTLTYEVQLRGTAIAVPEVSATVADLGAKMVITQAENLTDKATATIVVTAEDGETKKTYTITFKDVTGLDNIEATLNVYASENYLYVNNAPDGAIITVYDFSGVTIVQSFDPVIELPAKGFYIVRVNDQVFSVSNK